MHWQQRTRGGLSKVDVVVLIACVVIFAGLLLPQIKSRPHHRRHGCVHNLRSLAQAWVMRETARGSCTGYVNGRIGGPQVVIPESGESVPLPMTWAMDLLPQLDYQAVYEAITTDERRAGGIDANGRLRPETPAFPAIDFLRCPEDPRRSNAELFNSYVANTGTFIPPGGVTLNNVQYGRRQGEAVANSLFTNRYEGPTQVVDGFQAMAVECSSNDIRDGKSQTVLFTESTSAPQWYQFSRDSSDMRAMLRPDKYLNTMEVERLHGVGFTFQEERSELVLKFLRKPSSGHSDGWVVSFADGSTRYISDAVDDTVLMHLLLPHDSESLAAELKLTRASISDEEF